ARIPVMVTIDWNIGEVPPLDRWYRPPAPPEGKPLLDRDSVKILNERTPIRLLREAALSGSAPACHQRDFVLSAFTRALLLDDAGNGLPLAEKLRAMGADPQRYLDAYTRASDPDDRRFAGVFYILHHPEARPYLASG